MIHTISVKYPNIYKENLPLLTLRFMASLEGEVESSMTEVFSTTGSSSSTGISSETDICSAGGSAFSSAELFFSS